MQELVKVSCYKGWVCLGRLIYQQENLLLFFSMPSFKACLYCGWCDSRGSRVATGMGSELRPYVHERLCGCERKAEARDLSLLLALKQLSSTSQSAACVWDWTHCASVFPCHSDGTGKLDNLGAGKPHEHSPGFETRGERKEVRPA